VWNVLKETVGEQEAVLFARSASVGAQQFPVHWGGDCYANYESMAESLRGGLSIGLSGFGFWSHDIGGFENTAPAHVYKRWCAFGLYPATAACTAVNLTACRGRTMTSPATWCATLRS
jgi:alpha-D-xyloside xylohydrolase